MKHLSASDLCVCRDPEHEDKWRSTSHVFTYLTAIKQANKLLNVPAFCLEKYIFMMTWKVKFELRMLIFLWPFAGILGDCGENGPQDPTPPPTLHSRPGAWPFILHPPPLPHSSRGLVWATSLHIQVPVTPLVCATPHFSLPCGG